MKRFVTHLVIGIVTFSIGLSAKRILTADRHVAPVTKAPEVKPAVLSISEPPAPVSVTPPASDIIFDYDAEEFNPRGNYHVVGRKPNGFREFDALQIAVDEINGEVTGVVLVQTYSERTYHAHDAVSGLVTEKRLIFVIKPVAEKDFEYRFDGKFLRKGVLSDAGKNQVVLKGKLNKSKGGVKIAGGEIKFRVESLGC